MTITICPRLFFLVFHRPVDHPLSRADLTYPLLCLHGQGKPYRKGGAYGISLPLGLGQAGQARGKALTGSTCEERRVEPGELGEAQMKDFGGGSVGKASLGWFITLCRLRKWSPLNYPWMQWTSELPVAGCIQAYSC